MSDLKILPDNQPPAPPKPPPLPDFAPAAADGPPAPDVPPPPPPPAAPALGPDLESAVDMAPDPVEASAKVDNSIMLSDLLDMDPATAHSMHDSIVEQYSGKKESPLKFKERIKGYWRGAVTTQQLGELYAQIIFKGDSESLRKQIAELEAQMPPSEEIIEGLPQKMKRRFKEYYFGKDPYLARVKALMGETSEESLKLIVEQVPRWMQAGKEGGVLGSILMGTAMTITIAVGQIPPMTAMPEEGVTLPAAGALGMSVGMKVGAFKSLARISSGLALRNLENFEDSKGNKMDPTIAKYIAQGIGTVEGLSEMVEMSLIFKTFPLLKTAAEATKQAVVNTMMSNKFKKIVAKGLKKFAIYNVQELGQEVMQETVHIIGEELGKELNNAFKGTDIKKADIKEIVERYKETALASALMFPVLGLPGTITTTVKSIAQISKEKGIPIEQAKKVQEKEVEQLKKEGKAVVITEVVEGEELLEEGLELPPGTEVFRESNEKETINEIDLEIDQTFETGGKVFKVVSKTNEGTIVQSGKSQVVLHNFEEIVIDRDSLSDRKTPLKKDNISDVARKLWLEEIRNYKEYMSTDILAQIESLGKINVRYFAESEEIPDIPASVRKRIFTTDQSAADLDDMAASLGMSDTELIKKLQDYKPLEKPPTLKEYVEGLTIAHGTPLQRLLMEAEKDEALIKKTRSTMRKAYSLGKKEAALEARKKYQAAVMSKRARTELRDRLNKIVKYLKGVEKKTSKMYPEYAAPIKQLLDGIELVKHNRPFLLKLYDMKKYFDDNPEAEISNQVKERLSILDKRDLNNIMLDELEDLQTAVLHSAHLNKMAQQVRVGGQMWKRDVAIAKSISEMKPAKEIENRIVGHYGPMKSKIDKLWTDIKTFFGIGHMHYDLIVELLAGPNSSMDKVFFQEIKEGSTKQLDYRQKTFSKFWDSVQPILKEHKIKNVVKWLNETVTVGRVELTRNERMALFRHSLLDDNRETITDGGFGLRREKDPNKVYSMSEEGLNAILASLTPAEKEFAGKPIDILFDEQHEAMNKVFIEKNGYPLPKIDQYYRKDVMAAARRGDVDLESETAIEKFRGEWLRIGINKGMIKERQNVRVPIYLNALTYDINHSVMNAAAYVGLEMPLSNASKVLYDREFKGEFLSRYGRETYKAVEQGIRDIAGEWKSYGFFEEKLMKFRGRLTTAALGLNPFVAIKQPLSFASYLAYIKPQYLIRGTVEYLAHPKLIIDRHKLYSPEFTERVEKGFSRDVAEIMKIHSHTKFLGQKTFQESMMKPVQWFDLNTVAPGMHGAVLQVLSEFQEGKLSREVKQALDIEIKEYTPEEKMLFAYK